MGFDQFKKSRLLGVGKGAVLVLAGVIIGVLGVVMIVFRHQPSQSDLNKIRQQYTVQYITSEQTRLGINCHALRKTLQDFLVKDIRPTLQVRQPTQDWTRYFSQDARKRMGKLRDDYFACGALYRAAQSAQWDGFKDLDFTGKLDKEIITLNTLVGFGETGDDESLRAMQDAVGNIERRLASE
ncbi:MAG: hypothetical protein HZB95_12015 [Nitrosomonadales bacterium]|nr:hypothetical protein [Nitrosomonadales bacterium]